MVSQCVTTDFDDDDDDDDYDDDDNDEVPQTERKCKGTERNEECNK